MRLRLLIAMPFATLLGVGFGLAMASHLGGSFPAYASVITAVGLALVWVGGVLEHLALALLDRAHEAVKLIAPPVVDAVLGGVVGAWLAASLDANVLESVTVGSGFFALYTAIVRKVVLGEAIDEVFEWFGVRGRRAPPQYSLADALAVRGLTDAALAELESAAEEASHDPEPLLRGAQLLRDAGRYDDAVAWLRRARARVPAGGPRDAMITRQVVEVIRQHTDRPAAAAPELARMADRYRGTPDGDWAQRELREVKLTIR